MFSIDLLLETPYFLLQVTNHAVSVRSARIITLNVHYFSLSSHQLLSQSKLVKLIVWSMSRCISFSNSTSFLLMRSFCSSAKVFLAVIVLVIYRVIGFVLEL